LKVILSVPLEGYFECPVEGYFERPVEGYFESFERSPMTEGGES
jgi:hypothetical protein